MSSVLIRVKRSDGNVLADERVIATRWNDISAIAFATAHAREAVEPYLGARAGQRAHLVLGMLGEATEKRASGGVNSGGGQA